MNLNDTICAISTSLSSSAINIIRISGNNAIEIANKIVSGVNLSQVPSNSISHAYVENERGEKIDEILISLFRAPKSYTKEDVIEINTHGGSYVTTKVLELLLRNGCRLAEAGEFTKRAFLNGRIDLTEAESVMDMINAKTQASLSLANKGLSGDVKRLIDELRKSIEDLLLHITVNIDYPEYTDEVQISNKICVDTTTSLIDRINLIIEKAETMRIYKEGIKTVILGKPNVGKSSLLNAMLNENKAIVTSYGGTTRDTVEGDLNIGGIILHLIDTAGIRSTKNPIEKIGIEKSIEKLNEAELVLLVLDRTDFNETDKKLLDLTKDKNRIIILNKADLPQKIALDVPYLDVSALKKEGIKPLEDKIKEMFIKEELSSSDEGIISSSRHIALLKKSLESLNSALEGAKSGVFLDMIEIDLKDAYNTLGEITGEVAPDELINELFMNFCLGK